MNNGLESIIKSTIERSDPTSNIKELPSVSELTESIERFGTSEIKKPDISFIERTARIALFTMKETLSEGTGTGNIENTSESDSVKNEGLTDEEKAKIKEETGWSDEIIENIKNMKQYELLKNAGLKETEINGRKCLIKENIDLDYTDEDGISNRDRIARGLAPLDSRTGKPIELHHLGQKENSPLVELT